MKKLFIATLLGTTVFFAAISVITAKSIISAPLSNEAIEGKKIWQKKACVECHTLMGNGGYNAPDLTNVTSKLGPEKVKEFLKDRPIVRTSKGKRHLTLTSAEIDGIINFLSFVETIEIPKWPPKPIKSR